MTIKIRKIYDLPEDVDLDKELSRAISSEMSRKAWEVVCEILNRMQEEIDELREQVESRSTAKRPAAAKADAAE